MKLLRPFLNVWRKRYMKVLISVLFIEALTLGGILYEDSAWLAQGAWRGYYHLDGEPSPTEREDGVTWLLNGAEREGAFNITGARLKLRNLRGSFGRDFSPGLIDPTYIAPEEMEAPAGKFPERAIFVRIGDDLHLYPTNTMRRYDTANVVVGGKPLLIAYCFYAFLGCVYEREYEGRLHHFGSSGHIYYEGFIGHGVHSFLLFDRETESLWWPAGGKAVSGLMKDTPMKVLDRALWGHTTVEEAIQYASAEGLELKIIAREQDLEEIPDLPTYTTPAKSIDRFGWGPPESLPPVWGEEPAF